MTRASPSPADKSPLLILISGGAWLALAWFSWGVFAEATASQAPVTRVLLAGLHAAWMALWLWAIHNLVHQLASLLLPRPRLARSEAHAGAPVAILYLTCDDFDPLACSSCLAQDHGPTRLIICDDSQRPESRRAIDAWIAARPEPIAVSRREGRLGYKAGNLNHAIATRVEEDFFVVCDADEIIPTDFVSRLLRYFAGPGIGFVQAGHEARSDCATRFSAVLGPTIKLFHDFCLAMRNRFGFVSCYGHGVMIRRSAWQAAGGFPEIVSEDLGFASRALEQGLRGVFVREVTAWEAFPPNYRAFLAKYARIAGGTVEYFRREYPRLLASRRAGLVEKLDVLLTFSYCFGGLVTLFNILGALSLGLLVELEGQGHIALWVLAIWLLGPSTPLLAILSGLCGRPAKALRYLLTATVAYVSLVPILSARVLTQGWGRRSPGFEVTGVVATQSEPLLRYASIMAFGGCVLLAAVLLDSPALGPLLCFSLMLLSGPLMTLSERDGALGLIGRNCSFLPFAGLAGYLTWAI